MKNIFIEFLFYSEKALTNKIGLFPENYSRPLKQITFLNNKYQISRFSTGKEAKISFLAVPNTKKNKIYWIH